MSQDPFETTGSVYRCMLIQKFTKKNKWTQYLKRLYKLSLRKMILIEGKTARITTLTTPKHQNMTAVGEKIHKGNDVALRGCSHKHS